MTTETVIGPAETRSRIVEAAVAAFAAAGYDAVGVRQIAAMAEVSPGLLIRYFGSKAGLFAQAVETAFESEYRPFGDWNDLPESYARHFSSEAVSAPGMSRAMRIVVRSAASEESATVIAKYLRRRFIDPVAGLQPGPHASMRAELLAAILTGVHMLRDMLRTPGLAQSDQATLETALAHVIRACLSAPGDGTPSISPNSTEASSVS